MADDGSEKRGRGRSQKPAVPLLPWPVLTGGLVLGKDAFKRGEVVEVEVGRAPPKPATFIYVRTR